MAENVARYCPSCGARVKGAAELFASPQKCPKCQQVVLFSDYLREAPTFPPDPPFAPHQPDWFDRILYVALAGIAAVVLVAIGTLVTGNHSFAMFASVVSLCLSLTLVARFSQLSHQAFDSREHEKRAATLLEERTNALRDVLTRYNGFQLNFERLSADESERLQTEWRTRFDELEAKRSEALSIVAQRRADVLKEVQDARDAMANAIEGKQRDTLVTISQRRTDALKAIREARAQLAEAKDHAAVVNRLGARLLKDSVKFVGDRLTPNNYTQTQDKLLKVIEFCRKHEFSVSTTVERELMDELKREYQLVVKRDLERQEQARIKAQIREEQKAERELQRELLRIDAEKKAIQQALDEMIRQTHEAHSEEVEILRQKLREAEERAQRAVSMAQLTKCGHIYVISNIGSFGDRVFKIGMTRRLEPSERIKELGDASVPFPFDVHMMISCENAPSLENALHRSLHKHRVNKVNLRKEFFQTDIDTIRAIVEEHHGTVDYVADPEALEYFESESMTDETFEMLTDQYATVAVGPDEDEEFSVE